MDEHANPWDQATVQAWPDQDLTAAYDVSLKVWRDSQRPHDLRQIAEQNANVVARELKRRGIARS